MKNNRVAPLESTPTFRLSSAPTGLLPSWTNFWFTPIQPIGLHWLRVLSGLLFIFWLLAFAGHQAELFSMDGWCDRQAIVELSQTPDGPSAPIALWSLAYAFGDNPALNATAVNVLWWVAIGVFLLFTLGVATRVTAVLTWVFVVSFVVNPATDFDADFLLIILAFYLMIGYLLLGQWSGQPTLLGRLLGSRGTILGPWGRPGTGTSYAANLTMRLLQVHVAVILVTSALHKLQSGDWWSGVAFWYPLHPPFAMNQDRLRAAAQSAETTLFFLSLAQYLLLAWQISFPFFAWRPRWRWLLLSGGVLGWIGSIFIFGQPLFGPFYLIGCLSFLMPAEWQALTARMVRLYQELFGRVKAPADTRVSVRG